MNSLRTIGFCALLAAAAGVSGTRAWAAPSPAPSPVPSAAASATPTPNPAMLARAKSWFAQIQAGKIDRSQLSADINAKLTDAALQQAAGRFGKLGTPVTFEQTQTGAEGAVPYTVYLVTFGNGTKLGFLFAVDAGGKVAGMQIFAP